MHRKCCVCENDREYINIMFHRFPKDCERNFKWKEACGFKPNDDVKNLLVCQEHFRQEDYWSNLSGLRKQKLLRTAVPSLNIAKKSENKRQRLTLPLIQKSDFIVNELNQAPDVQPGPSHAQEPNRERSIAFNYQESIAMPNVQVIESNTTVTKTSNLPQTPESTITELFDPYVEPTSSHSQEQNLVGSGCHTPQNLGRSGYIGCLRESDFSTPTRRKLNLSRVQSTIKNLRQKNKSLQIKNNRLLKRVKTLNDLLNVLKKKNLLDNASMNSITEQLPNSLQSLVNLQIKGKGKHRSYSPDIRAFALTLNFYSAKAYNYVRSHWNKLLPHPGTLTQWLKVIEAKPGFTKESFETLKARSSKIEGPLIINLVVDEMSIRKQIIYNRHNGFSGFVDMGFGIESDRDNGIAASNAFVVMGVGVNDHFKIPLAFFLVNGLAGHERAQIIRNCLKLLFDISIKTFSLTFDGASSNISMCTNLGANFNYEHQFKPWFINPYSKEKVFCFFDAVHMVKLIRNTLGDKQVLYHKDKEINWKYIQKLHNVQQKEQLTAANKISNKHINYKDNKMKAKYAVQTLSKSVCDSLLYCKALKIHDFGNCEETAEFCNIFNKCFDILNCRSKYFKNNYCKPITDLTFGILKKEAEDIETYIINLKSEDGRKILHSERKTGFLGMIVNLRNVFDLFILCKNYKLSYLLSYKLSQDFLENFFCAIRSRGGHNNNPNAIQFQSAYRRLLSHHQITTFDKGNCLEDACPILSVSSRSWANPIEETDDASIDDFDIINTLKFSPFVEGIIDYIGGFIARRSIGKVKCSVCCKYLIATNRISLLSYYKSRGRLLCPSANVKEICCVTESIIRQYKTVVLGKKNYKL